jgi:hypothetical protein
MFFDNPSDPDQFARAEAVVTFDFDQLQPELRPPRFSLNMDVGRFMFIAREKEEPIRPGPQNGRRHVLGIVPSSA